MTKEKLVDLVTKLLELASNPGKGGEGEAQTALQRAQELIQKYNLEVFERKNEEETRVEKVLYSLPPHAKGGSGLVNQIPFIADTVSRMFGCRVLIGRGGLDINLYGFPTNLKLAQYAIDSIVIQGCMDYRAGYKKFKTVTFSEAFWLGFKQALRKRFEVQMNQANAVVLYDKVKAEVGKLSAGNLFGEFQSTNSTFGLSSGQESGSKAQIRKGLTEATQNKGKLLV